VTLADDALLVQGVTTRAGSFELGPIDLDVASGRVLSILGPSGAGKTMLLETIAGFRAAVAGNIRLFGRELGQLPPESRAVGFVFRTQPCSRTFRYARTSVSPCAPVASAVTNASMSCLAASRSPTSPSDRLAR